MKSDALIEEIGRTKGRIESNKSHRTVRLVITAGLLGLNRPDRREARQVVEATSAKELRSGL